MKGRLRKSWRNRNNVNTILVYEIRHKNKNYKCESLKYLTLETTDFIVNLKKLTGFEPVSNLGAKYI